MIAIPVLLVNTALPICAKNPSVQTVHLVISIAQQVLATVAVAQQAILGPFANLMFATTPEFKVAKTVVFAALTLSQGGLTVLAEKGILETFANTLIALMSLALELERVIYQDPLQITPAFATTAL